jgi:hypothetical protein
VLISHPQLDSILRFDITQLSTNSQVEIQVEHKLYIVGILYKIYLMRTKSCTEEMLAKLLTAYTGSLHPIDQLLLKVRKN